MPRQERSSSTKPLHLLEPLRVPALPAHHLQGWSPSAARRWEAKLSEGIPDIFASCASARSCERHQKASACSDLRVPRWCRCQEMSRKLTSPSSSCARCIPELRAKTSLRSPEENRSATLIRRCKPLRRVALLVANCADVAPDSSCPIIKNLREFGFRDRLP